MFLHSSVKASQAMTDVKEVWIVIHNKSQTENQILWAWCLCIAGVYETCNMSLLVFVKLTMHIQKDSLMKKLTDV